MTAIVGHEPVRAGARRTAAEHVSATNAVAHRFFGENADAIAHTCRAMAERFHRGGRLFVCGEGAQRSDVAHVVVEFVHPVVVGKRALPALPLPSMVGGAALDTLATLSRSGDIVMVLSAASLDESARAVLAMSRAHGLLTIALVGPADPADNGGGAAMKAEHLFVVPSSDPCIVQETHEMLYHVLWELVHVFFEHRAVGA